MSSDDRRRQVDAVLRMLARFLLAAWLLAGCGRAAPADSPPAAQAGRRVVVMAPGAAEMLESLGLLDRVVGVGDFVDWPLRLRELPKVGAYDAPNAERLLGLRADMLITTVNRAGSARLAQLEKLGIAVVQLELSTYDGVFSALAELGERFGRRAQAAALVRDMRSRLERVRLRAAGAPRRRVLFVVGRDPLYVAGPGSHLDRLIRLAGGENLLGDSRAPYALTSMEVVLRRLPEVILDSSDNRPGTGSGRRLGAWAEWPFLPAVRDRRVYVIDPWRLSIPGPRLPEMAELMGKLIHPEIFGEAADGELGPPPAPGAR
ncbi:MAG TPA: helical backbone metal receptor [Thermoanaerobaculia bacterium]|nr:helical backbone metal receptor [Thermoanaerobaculia bacterium]